MSEPIQSQPGSSRDTLKGLLVSSLVCLAAVGLSNMGAFLFFLIPLPTLYYRIKLGRQKGFIILITSAIIMMCLLRTSAFHLSLFVELLVLGFILAEVMTLNVSVEKTLGYTSLVILMIEFLLLLFYSNASHQSVQALISEQISSNIELFLAQTETNGIIQDETARMLSAHSEENLTLFVGILPGLSVASVLFICWICILLARPLLKSTGLFFPDFGPLNQWKASDYFVWGVIGSGLLFTLYEVEALPILGVKILAINGFIIFFTLYFFQGIAVISFFFDRKHLPLFFRVLTYSLIAIQPPLIFFVISLGFFEIWFDFRKKAQTRLDL